MASPQDDRDPGSGITQSNNSNNGKSKAKRKRSGNDNLKITRPCPSCGEANGMAALTCMRCNEKLREKSKEKFKKENYLTSVSSTKLKGHIQKRTNQLYVNQHTHCMVLYYSENPLKDHVSIQVTPGVAMHVKESIGHKIIGLWTEHTMTALRQNTAASQSSDERQPQEVPSGEPQGEPSEKPEEEPAMNASPMQTTEENISKSDPAEAGKWHRMYDGKGEHVGNAHYRPNQTSIHCNPVPEGCGVFMVVAVLKQVPLFHPFLGENMLERNTFVAWPMKLVKAN